ncbi:PhoH family protein [Parvularcula sp. LCG005]|uniref:PhoH family protein n=1 Tax=Parvularcula sp. LCG005 TaxID=3078805 RepID=UPI002942577D|nr:PhoH family protein [Parvularcula sp. LCG005]WOI53350.1 PhoH family protein [Parvularcula sp. LCG005]
MTTETLTFEDNARFVELCGPHDTHLMLLEQRLGVELLPRGNTITLKGPEGAREEARAALTALYQRLQKGLELSLPDVEAALRLLGEGEADAETGKPAPKDLTLTLPRRSITPRTPAQAHYMNALRENELVFGVGPAGTGKTYLAVAHGISMLLRGEVERLILSRPAVEAGERIGFLPGDMKEKVDPYLRPLYDALYDVVHADLVDKRIEKNEIEIAPLAFMRGRTLARAYVILDEAQNASIAQMKMFLTRLGEGSRMVITGDPSQTDLPNPSESGLADALGLLTNIEGVAVTRFTGDDVVRHRLVRDIVKAYDDRAARRAAPRQA